MFTVVIIIIVIIIIFIVIIVINGIIPPPAPPLVYLFMSEPCSIVHVTAERFLAHLVLT